MCTYLLKDDGTSTNTVETIPIIAFPRPSTPTTETEPNLDICGLIATAMRSYQRISSSNLEAPAVLHSQHQQLDWQAGSIWAVYLVSLIEDYREVLS